MNDSYAAVWGFGSTGSSVGVISTHATRPDAQAAASAAEKVYDNPACGCWVEERCEECGRFKAAGCRC